MFQTKFSLRDILIQEGLVTSSFFETYKNIDDESLFTLLQHHRVFSEQILHASIGKSLGYQILNSNNFSFDPSLSSDFFNNLKQKYCLPLYETATTLALAVNNPFVLKDFNFSKRIEVSLAPKEYLLEKLGIINRISIEEIIKNASLKHSSDIHFYSQDHEGCDIYFRINGALHFFQSVSKNDYRKILQKVKLDASLDLGLYKVPQEGFLHLHSLNLDIRISIIPTVHLEDMVLRLFKKKQHFETFYDLTDNLYSQQLINSICSYKNGLILVTGPTGSGKTTTLYSMLRFLKLSSRGVIVSLEDPVENHIYGIRQSNILPHKNYTFEKGLKAVLRQDPDIILLGEIRDKATAKIALEAAYTGHLVLSSLHTHDVYSTLLRLKSFDLDPFLVRYVLRGIIAQDLVPSSTEYTHLLDNKANSTMNLSRKLNQEILHFNKPFDLNLLDCTSLPELGDYKNWD